MPQQQILVRLTTGLPRDLSTITPEQSIRPDHLNSNIVDSTYGRGWFTYIEPWRFLSHAVVK
jgi:hypothetical protein